MTGLYALDGLAPEVPADGDFWIAPGAAVIGEVRLGRKVSVWFGAAIRGDTERIEIGDGTNVQECSVLHTDPGFPLTIGADCTIGHSAIVHGCTIGDGVLVGMGATVLNGARIGPRCLVGANALVTEGKEFPEGWLIVGSPAKAVRPLDEATLARLVLSAETYRARARRFKAGLRPVG